VRHPADPPRRGPRSGPKGRASYSLDLADYSPESQARLAKAGYDIPGGLLTAVPHPGYRAAAHVVKGAEPTRVLAEGDLVDLGDRAFEMLHLPGHSPGSIGL
jgi:glyoxylase-like metal-dependent hydrolase (beta-lactamase superfamily II)